MRRFLPIIDQFLRRPDIEEGIEMKKFDNHDEVSSTNGFVDLPF